jgi:hypothetical protein
VKLEPVFDLGRDSDREGRVLRRATVVGSTSTASPGFRLSGARRQWRKAVLLALIGPPDARYSRRSSSG